MDDVFKEQIESSSKLDNQVKADLEQMLSTPGWAILHRVLHDTVAHFQHMLENQKFDDINQVRFLQYKIAATKKLMGVGEMMVAAIEQQGSMPTLDPFATVDEEFSNNLQK